MLRALRVERNETSIEFDSKQSALGGVSWLCQPDKLEVRIETDEPTVDAAVNVDGMDVGGMSMSDVQGMDVGSVLPDVEAGLSTRQLEHDGVTRSYKVYVPTSYTNDNPMR